MRLHLNVFSRAKQKGHVAQERFENKMLHLIAKAEKAEKHAKNCIEYLSIEYVGFAWFQISSEYDSQKNGTSLRSYKIDLK